MSQGTIDQYEKEIDAFFEQVDKIDAAVIRRKGIDDVNMRNRLKFDIIFALEQSRYSKAVADHTKALKWWTMIIAIATVVLIIVDIFK